MERNTLFEIVLAFCIGIGFGVILPTADVSSDLYLMINTLQFVGDGIGMTGCRACFSKSRGYIHEQSPIYNKECTVCTSDKDAKGETGFYCAGFPDAFNKIISLQDSSKCETQSWHFGPSSSLIFKKGSCEDGDYCCVGAGIEPSKSMVFPLRQEADARIR